ncbi:MAG: DNA polymerase III subunit epsilon [Xanthomonadales bacterium]|nr:DNA polymerase III subunit epsilon [Xanthomonadales bacterium]
MSERQIFLDTETTGLRVEEGHRIIEIGAVEMIGRRLTGRSFHERLDPEREIEEGAQRVHGMDRESLRGKPRFADVAERLLAFLEGAEILIHNAPFDVGFLEAELARCGARVRSLSEIARVTDTLALARELFPGQPASLDRLCRRFGVEASHRVYHGALLDAELLAQVYLRMTQGQTAFELSAAAPAMVGAERVADADSPGPLPLLPASAEERRRHEARLAAIRARAGRCLWPSPEGIAERGTG